MVYWPLIIRFLRNHDSHLKQLDLLIAFIAGATLIMML